MRILTSILMLCLPMAAMAETYLCRTEKTAYLQKTFGDVSESDLVDWVIDTDSGIRKLEDGQSYAGQCKKSELGIICSNENNITGGIYFYMRLSDKVFTSSLHNLGNYVTSDFGTCTEI